MARIDFQAAGGGTIIPVAAADFLSPLMSASDERSYFVIRFFSDALAQTQVAPGAGTVAFTASNDRDKDLIANFLTVPNGAFNGVDAYAVGRAVPLFVGPCVKAKLTLAGITVATHFTAYIARF
jgi:hypothetical protein